MTGKFMRLRRLLPLDGDCTFIFVCSFTGNTSAVVGDGDDGWIGVNKLRNREFEFRFSVGEDGTNARLLEPYEPGTFALWTLVRDGSCATIYKNGKLATERSKYVSSGTTINLGLLMGMRPHNVNFKGELAELLIFSTSLSVEGRSSVEQYLMDKYDLTNNELRNLPVSANDKENEH